MGKFSKIYIAQTNIPEPMPEQFVMTIIKNEGLNNTQKKSIINQYLLDKQMNINTLNLPDDFRAEMNKIIYSVDAPAGAQKYELNDNYIHFCKSFYPSEEVLQPDVFLERLTKDLRTLIGQYVRIEGVTIRENRFNIHIFDDDKVSVSPFVDIFLLVSLKDITNRPLQLVCHSGNTFSCVFNMSTAYGENIIRADGDTSWEKIIETFTQINDTLKKVLFYKLSDKAKQFIDSFFVGKTTFTRDLLSNDISDYTKLGISERVFKNIYGGELYNGIYYGINSYFLVDQVSNGTKLDLNNGVGESTLIATSNILGSSQKYLIREVCADGKISLRFLSDSGTLILSDEMEVPKNANDVAISSFVSDFGAKIRQNAKETILTMTKSRMNEIASQIMQKYGSYGLKQQDLTSTEILFTIENSFTFILTADESPEVYVHFTLKDKDGSPLFIKSIRKFDEISNNLETIFSFNDPNTLLGKIVEKIKSLNYNLDYSNFRNNTFQFVNALGDSISFEAESRGTYHIILSKKILDANAYGDFEKADNGYVYSDKPESFDQVFNKFQIFSDSIEKVRNIFIGAKENVPNKITLKNGQIIERDYFRLSSTNESGNLIYNIRFVFDENPFRLVGIINDILGVGNFALEIDFEGNKIFEKEFAINNDLSKIKDILEESLGSAGSMISDLMEKIEKIWKPIDDTVNSVLSKHTTVAGKVSYANTSGKSVNYSFDLPTKDGEMISFVFRVQLEDFGGGVYYVSRARFENSSILNKLNLDYEEQIYSGISSNELSVEEFGKRFAAIIEDMVPKIKNYSIGDTLFSGPRGNMATRDNDRNRRDSKFWQTQSNYRYAYDTPFEEYKVFNQMMFDRFAKLFEYYYKIIQIAGDYDPMELINQELYTQLR